MAVLLWLVALMGLLSGRALAADSETREGLTIRWTPSCTGFAGVELFSMTISDIGAVTYLGGELMKERGVRKEEIGRRYASEIIAMAKATSQGSTEVISKDLQFKDASYCLNVRIVSGPAESDFSIDSYRVAARKLIEHIRKYTSEAVWTCPPRRYADDPGAFDGRRFCSDQLNELALELNVFNEQHCEHVHVDIFPEEIYWRTSTRAGLDGGRSQILNDKFMRLSRAQYRALLRRARSFDAISDPIGDLHARSYTSLVFGEADLTRLLQDIEKIGGSGSLPRDLTRGQCKWDGKKSVLRIKK